MPGQAGPQVNHSPAEEWVWPAERSQLELPRTIYTFKHGSHQCLLCRRHFTTLEGIMTGSSGQKEFSRQLSKQAGDSW